MKILAAVLSALILMNLYVFGARRATEMQRARDQELAAAQMRAARLEAEQAQARARQDDTSLSRFNEVRVNGQFVGFRERGPGLIQGVVGAGYSDMPVGEHLDPVGRQFLSGPGILPR